MVEKQPASKAEKPASKPKKLATKGKDKGATSKDDSSASKEDMPTSKDDKSASNDKPASKPKNKPKKLAPKSDKSGSKDKDDNASKDKDDKSASKDQDEKLASRDDKSTSKDQDEKPATQNQDEKSASQDDKSTFKDQDGKSASQDQDEKSAPKNEKKDGEDLTTVLDKSQRADLTLLIADITESMRNIIVKNFDASAGLDESFIRREGMTDDEKMMSADTKADPDKNEKQKKMKADFEKDIDTPKMKNLKKNALKAYDDWREQVIQRVGEVLDSEDTAKEQIEKSKSTQARPKAPTTTTAGKITEAPKQGTNLKFKDLFPSTKTPLTRLSMDKRTLVLHSILLLLLSLEHYNAASRILLLNITSSLKLSLKTFEQDEYVTAKGLLENAKELSADEETKKKSEENKDTRQKKVRYAAIAGAAIIGVAGGFAAPLLASGIGSVATGLGLGTTAAAGYLGSVASSTLLVGSLFGAYGGRMTGQMMDQYARDIEDFEFLPVHSNQKTSEDPSDGAKQASEHDHKLRVTICLSGWLREKEEVIKPWRVVGSGAEVFALKYELEALLNLGNAMDGMVSSAAWGYAQQELIQSTVFADLMAAMWPVALLKVARVLDNPFSVAKARAEKVGEVLAEVLVNRAQGERPVTLIGYSLGARAIYVCLQNLAKMRAFNLVENAILIGAPTPSDTSDWRVLRTAVTGRLINVHSSNDYILGFMYRTSSIQYGIAGLQPIEGLPGVENVDVSEDVDGHLRYRFLIGGILKKIGFEDIDMQAVEEEREALKKMVEEEKKNSLQAQRNRLMRKKSYKKDGKVDEDAQAEDEASDLEKQVKEKTEKSLVTRAIEWWYTPNAPNTKDAEKIASNLERAISNPSEVSAAANDTLDDVRNSSMAQRVYKALPNIPYMGSSGTTGGVPKADPNKVADDATKQAEGYRSRAAAYLPHSMPAMPSMPNIPGYSKKEDTTSKPAKTTKDAGQTAKNATNTATETVGTTVKNTANIKDNPATKQVKEAPGVKQALEKDPGVTQTLGKVTDAVGTTVSNTTDQATGAAGSAVDNVGKGGGKAVDTADSGAQKAADAGKGLASGKGEDASKNQGSQQQSYASYATSYLPSLPSWRSSSQKQDEPAQPERKPSEQKPERKKSSQAGEDSQSKEDSQEKKKPAKLGRKGSSTPDQAKSPPPKLGQRKASEPGAGTKSPLQRVQSGTKGATDNMPNIAENVPGSDSAKKAAGAPQQAAKQGTDAAGQAASKGQQAAGDAVSQGQDAVKKGTDAAGQAASNPQQAAKDGAGQAVSQGQQAAKKGTDVATGAASQGQEAVSNTASKGKDVATGAVAQGQQAAKKGSDVATGAASQGQQALSDGAKKGTDAATGAASQGQQAVSNTASKGKDVATGAASQGQQAVSSGASGVTGAVGGAFSKAKFW
ncbi:hypothetical protein LTR70_002991 [Exophiala xenobiotica]|uniref:DUF726-domain-containing protein n=1 Tax=Lithohypha guttulata TaxID=1690604 RepID=A0ABR0K829_9EURO|nr:hypothetical protein LTR24_005671 [Lithohypha guttulata]KAK5324361.1 hypothetical protein LTR70_002991 [Exophiala xenobiotica]